MNAAKKLFLENINLSFHSLGKTGPMIVLLHGWGASKERLFPLGKALTEIGFRVLIPDLPGFGKSSLPSRPWGVGEYADFISKVIDKFYGKKKVYLFGHSFGGRVAIKIASRYPKKIAGIALCGSAGISRGNFFKRIFFLILAKTGKQIFPQSERPRRLIYRLAREHDYEKTRGVMRETFKLVISEDLNPLLPKIKIPTLILWGTEDKMTPVTDGFILEKTIPKAKLVLFEGKGHQLPYEKVKKIARVVNSWSQSS